MSDVERRLNVDGIESLMWSDDILRSFFSIKNDHESEFYSDAMMEVIPCVICVEKFISWGGAFHSWDSPGDTRDITITF